MERIVVMRTKEGFWSVSHNGRTISVHLSEEEALSATFALASSRRRNGVKMVVVITGEGKI